MNKQTKDLLMTMRELKLQEKELKAQIALTQAKLLKTLTPGTTTEFMDVKVIYKEESTRSTFDTKAFQAKHPKIYQSFVVEKPVAGGLTVKFDKGE